MKLTKNKLALAVSLVLTTASGASIASTSNVDKKATATNVALTVLLGEDMFGILKHGINMEKRMKMMIIPTIKQKAR